MVSWVGGRKVGGQGGRRQKMTSAQELQKQLQVQCSAVLEYNSSLSKRNCQLFWSQYIMYCIRASNLLLLDFLVKPSQFNAELAQQQLIEI